MKKPARKSTTPNGTSDLARVQGVSRQAVFNRFQRPVLIAQGLCPYCGGQEKRDFNPKTGKPYSRGPRCRAAYKARMRQYMADKASAAKTTRRTPLF